MDDSFQFKKIVTKLSTSKRILFITGAGISADSGLPTYRGIGGLYDGQITKDGISIEKVLSGENFKKNPAIVWEYLSKIEKSCRQASFNEAHQIIAKIEEEFEHVCILTQNIDNLHKKAGSQNIIEIHGSLYNLECTKCQYKEVVKDYSILNEIPPICIKCKAIIRPAVVLFGEMLASENIKLLEQELTNSFDLIFSIGTTSIFPYIVEPIFEAKKKQICTVEINPGETGVSHLITYKLATTAQKAMLEIYKQWQKLQIN